MKKFLLLSSGLFLIAASLIPFSSASRNAYHVWLMQQAEKKAAIEDTKYYHPFEKITTERLTNPLTHYFRNTSQRNLNFTPIVIPSVETNATLRLNEAYRRSSNQLSPLWTSPLKRSAIVFKRIKDAVKEFETYNNDSFSILIPKGWDQDKKKTRFFSSQKSDYTITIKKFENACDNVSFTTCAISLSYNENRKNEDGPLALSSLITRQTQFQNTIQGSMIQTKTVTESFSANIKGKEYYLSRFFIADTKGGVYLIETRSSLKNASSYVGVSKAIFDSFQMYGKNEDLIPVPTSDNNQEMTPAITPELEINPEEIPSGVVPIK